MVVLREQSRRCSSRGQFLYKSATGIFTFRIALVGNSQLFCRASGKAQWSFGGKVGVWCLRGLINMLPVVSSVKSSFEGPR